MKTPRYLLLDRDGTLIVEKEYLHKPELVELIPGSGEALASLMSDGWRFVVISNQSGVGRGYFERKDVDRVNDRVAELLAAHGVTVDGWYYDVSHPDAESDARKPRPSLVLEASRDLGFALADCIVVGDKDSDLELAERIGAPSVLVLTGYGKTATRMADFTINSIADMGEVVGSIGGNLPPGWVESRISNHQEQIQQAASLWQTQCGPDVHRAAVICADSFQQGGKLMLCGNGGSAADCQHLATEFTVRLSGDRERPGLPAIALTTDTSYLTAFPNDYCFEDLFARQVETLGKHGDVLICFSTSGNSPNILAAVEAGLRKGIKVISFTGESGSLAGKSDVAIRAPGGTTMRIQELHLMSYHVLVDLVECLIWGLPG